MCHKLYDEFVTDQLDPRVRRTRERVLGAARDLVLADGLGALTHLELERRSGVARRTIYRHWPTVDALVYDTLTAANFPRGRRSGEIRADLMAHLEALRTALVDGPLAYLLHALGERAALDPSLAEVRRRLIDDGCAPIRDILRAGVDCGDLRADLDIETAAGDLEGPLFYRRLVRDEPIDPVQVERLVDRFVESAGAT